MNARLAGRLALVTGATRGIGRAVALAYAREGAHLILVGRTTGALEEVDDEVRMAGGSATLLTLNLKQQDKIDGLGPTIYQRWGKLDILVGNAGILGPLSPLGHVSADAWSEVIEINLTANWRLIRTLDPLLRRSDAGRAIFVSSGVAVTPRAYWGPYATSKAALDALARTYAAETVNTSNIRVMLINPGPLRTLMRAKAMPGEDPSTLRAPQELAPKIVAICSPEWTETGKLYDFPSDALLSFRAPEPAVDRRS